MDYYTSSTILSAVIIFLSIILALFLLTVPAENKKSNRFLAGFLLFTALDLSVFLYDQFISFPPVIEMLRIRSSAFKNPLLYLYLLAVIQSDFKLKPRHLIHTLPFLIPVLVLMPRFFFTDAASRLQFLENYGDMAEIQFIRIFANLTTVIYLSAMVLLLQRFRKVVLQNSSYQDNLRTYKWLFQFVMVIILLWAVTFFKELLKFDDNIGLLNNFRTLILVFGVGFITWFVLKALHSPHLFRGINSEAKSVKEHLREKPEENYPEEDPGKERVEELRNFMLSEEPFLDPSLSIKDLASRLNTSARELSLLINQEIGQHFFDFVNEYRIEKAKVLLADPKNIKITVQEILFDVGFNSKTPFNTAFKKHTGMTPTQFRKSLSTSCL